MLSVQGRLRQAGRQKTIVKLRMCGRGWQQPHTADDDGEDGRCGQHGPMRAMMTARVAGRHADNRRERRHRGHSANPERADIRDGGGARGEGECRNHTEEVRAARDAMQHAEAERRVRVPEIPEPAGPGVDVQVIVVHVAMGMGRRMHLEAAPQRPDADHDQRCANEPLAPGGDNVDRRQRVTKEDGQQRHDNNSRRVADAPRPAGDPSASAAVDNGERRDRGKMVRSRQDVKETGECACNGC